LGTLREIIELSDKMESSTFTLSAIVSLFETLEGEILKEEYDLLTRLLNELSKKEGFLL